MKSRIKVLALMITVLVILITIVLLGISRRSFYIVILGENPVTIYEGTSYEEPGYFAYDSNDQDVTSMVKIESDLNPSQEGNYKIKYVIEDKAEITRSVIVKEVIPDDLEVSFSLKGNAIQDIERDNPYQEAGYTALGNNGRDYSKHVTVSGSVDVTKVGTYQIKYELKVGSVEKTLNRTINVVGKKYTVSFDNTNYTNKNIVVQLKNNLKEFGYFVDSYGKVINEERIDFLATDNGTYTFYLYDEYGHSEEININVDNIDRVLPTVTCKGSVNGKNKTFQIKAEDEHGIGRYVYDGNEYPEPTFTVPNNDSDVVAVYDKAGNVNKVTCEYESIKSKGNIIANYNSSTLKYWIEKPDPNYVITHIWVKNGYSQIKTAVNAKIGVLETARTILNREMSKKNYNSKGMVAINASAFVMNLSNPLIKYNSSWKYSSDAPVIIVNGKVLRNFTNSSLPSTLYPVYGLKSNGYVSYFNFDGGKESIEKNKNTLELLKSEGVKYTFSFNPILVIDGESQVNMKSNNIRQGFCQIDRNNFVIITNTNPVNKRRLGLSFRDLANIMVKLNCKSGYNLDGGGSVSLYYKNASSGLKNVKVSNRKIADILYFVEQ